MNFTENLTFIFSLSIGVGKSTIATLLLGKEPTIDGVGSENCLAIRTDRMQIKTTIPCAANNDEGLTVVDTQGVNLPTPGKFAIDIYLYNRIKRASVVILVYHADFSGKHISRTTQDFLLYFYWLPLHYNIQIVVTHNGNITESEKSKFKYLLDRNFDVWYHTWESPPYVFISLKPEDRNSSMAELRQFYLKHKDLATEFDFPETELYQYSVWENHDLVIVVSVLGSLFILAAIVVVIFICWTPKRFPQSSA